jgi:hypothetical protein
VALPQLAAGFCLVSNGEDRDGLNVKAMQGNMAAASKIDQPFPEFWIHVCYRLAGARLVWHDFHPRANGVCGALRRVDILGTGKAAAYRSAQTGSRSAVACRRLNILAGFQLCEPDISLFKSQVLAGLLILVPSAQGILFEAFALFFLLDILLYRFAHDPVCRPPARFGQTLQTAFQSVIELDGRWQCHAIASLAKSTTCH